MASATVERVRKRRATLRRAGLRPVQIWVPDTRRPGFAAERRRQSRLIAEADRADAELAAFMDAALADIDREGDVRVRRGDFVTVPASGDFGKLRPALIVQADAFAEHPSLTVLLLSSALVEAPLLRLTVTPDAANGLRQPLQIMIDKTVTVMRGKIGQTFGRLDANAMLEVERRMAVFLGIAK